MINYADYNFYEKEYKGNLSIDLFNSFIVKASREIDNNINRELDEEYISNMSEKDQYKLKYVACELCDYFKNNGSYTSGNASSVSIDGVSINRGNITNEQKKVGVNNIINNLPLELIRYL